MGDRDVCISIISYFMAEDILGGKREEGKVVVFTGCETIFSSASSG
jgi:hypothetical protein